MLGNSLVTIVDFLHGRVLNCDGGEFLMVWHGHGDDWKSLLCRFKDVGIEWLRIIRFKIIELFSRSYL